MKRFCFFAIASLISGCSAVSVEQRREHADVLAHQQGWRMLKIPAGQFVLAAYAPLNTVGNGLLTIYIEGDGMAWISSSQPSLDPTPVSPVGLELALGHPDGRSAYLARPCQFVQEEEAANCAVTYWTDRRFAAEVIDSTNQAIDHLKVKLQAERIALVGYSGGGAVAALVAARRSDIERIVTVAGNMDHQVWSKLHRATPLRYSLNPADAWKALQHVPQLHLVGARDNNITPEVIQSYLSRFSDRSAIKMRVISGFDHACCWSRDWKALLTNQE